MRAKQNFFWEEEKVAYTQSYTYLRATFSEPWLSLWRHDVLNFLVERQPFMPLKGFRTYKIPRSKTTLWWFDKLVKPTLFCGEEIWGLITSFNDCLHDKVHYDIIQTEMGATPIVTIAYSDHRQVSDRFGNSLIKATQDSIYVAKTAC